MTSLALGLLLAGTTTMTAPSDFLLDPSPYRARLVEGPGQGEVSLDNGLIRRTFRLGPNMATVALDNRMTGASMLRAVRPEVRLTLNGREVEVGGLKGQPNQAFLAPEWLDRMTADPNGWMFLRYESGPIRERFAWKRVRHRAPDAVWPPKGVEARFLFVPPVGHGFDGVTLTVHYEMLDGLPVIGKWFTLDNQGKDPVTVDRFVSETLALVEAESRVEHRDVATMLPNVHVQTDYAFGGDTATNANRWAVHWREDPTYQTQVSYLLKTPCLLEIGPEVGPAQDVPPGGRFESLRAWVLVHDTTDRERKGLQVRKLLRALAPWSTENPLMMHMRSAEEGAVRTAIDQCAAVGFEMLILSFGSGFDMENDDPGYLAKWKGIADYARSKGVEIGSYSLLASRRVSPDSDNAINPKTGTPEGQTFGTAPALASGWGQVYFRKLYRIFPETGFSLLEHDGSYPGDYDAAARPPLQKGADDSQWVQWRIVTDFYKWCRANGVYLNIPDYYFLNGGSKIAMGYRETNWSLPRAQQVIHARQNIYDGTWEKAPSMGWMFVPLTEYQGGGAAATIEPLDENLDTYERHLANCLGMGVQACYRGPRLYDTDRTKAAVGKWVAWYKAHRDILESDMIHLRRADARDWDGMLHVNPTLSTKGMAVLYNPLSERINRTIELPLYYTGLSDRAKVRVEGGRARSYRLDRDRRISVKVGIPAGGMTWLTIE
ncbi:MAG: hypothetical protein KIS66_15050 [Fimbriimonadaceae bacterium]|nr:hypothetical protein [Fimbriimonadaceae bacterium]